MLGLHRSYLRLMGIRVNSVEVIPQSTCGIRTPDAIDTTGIVAVGREILLGIPNRVGVARGYALPR
jgi:hypothetical protein